MMKQPLALIVGLFVVGIISYSYLTLSSFQIFCCVLFMIISAVMLRNKKTIFTAAMLMCIIFLGNFYVHVAQKRSLDDISRLSYKQRRSAMSLKGVIISDVEDRAFFNTKKTVFTLLVHKVKVNEHWFHRKGKVLVNVFQDLNVEYGDKIILEGKLHRPFVNDLDDTFSYRDYLNIRAIDFIFSVKKTTKVIVVSKNKGHWLRRISYKVRNHLKTQFDTYLTPNESGIMRAIILGDRSKVPKHVKELFIRTGTAHVLAISGLHIGAVSLMFLFLLRFLPLSGKTINAITLVILGAYVLLTAARPSVLRASIMIAVVLLGRLLERKSNTLNSLSFAAMVILLLNPLNVYDVGFQLSFCCLGAIIFVYPRLRSLVGFKKGKGRLAWLCDSLLFSFSIWICIDGLIVYYFNIITPVSVLANLVVVPMIGVIVSLGFLLQFVVVCVPFLAPYVALTLKLSLNILAGSTFLFDKLPLSYFTFSVLNHWYILGYYITLILLICFFSKIDKQAQV